MPRATLLPCADNILNGGVDDLSPAQTDFYIREECSDERERTFNFNIFGYLSFAVGYCPCDHILQIFVVRHITDGVEAAEVLEHNVRGPE